MNRQLVVLSLAPFFFASLFVGCGGEPATTDTLDDGLAQRAPVDLAARPLGWLDATCRTSESTQMFTDADSQEEITPGGVVLVDVSTGGIAEQTGLKVGDAIVRVAGNWLPFKEDPSPDLMRLIEEQVSAGKKQIELGIANGEEITTKFIEHDLSSLDEGLPLAVQRYEEAIDNALERLCTLQRDDGSFAVEGDSLPAIIRTTAVASLALHGGGASDEGSKFHEVLSKSREFLATQIDSHVEERATSKPASSEPADGNTPKLVSAKSKLDPITTAYALQFLAEAEIPVLQAEWMQRLSSLVACIADSQSDSGGWMTAQSRATSEVEAEADEAPPSETQVDPLGTHATNQVLLALGALERKGMMGDNKMIANACKYLKEQATARVADGSMDRRTKAALLAGTAAAMTGVNCDRADGFLISSGKECAARTSDLFDAPELAMSGLVSNALFARAMGNEAWIAFHNATKYQWAGRLDSSGRLHVPKNMLSDDGDASWSKDATPNSEAWQTAQLCIMLAAQSDQLEKLTGQTQSPMMARRDSDGKKTEGSSVAGKIPGLPAGAKVIKLEGKSLEDMKDQLKDMGIDLDGDNVQMIQAGEAPGKN